MRHRSELFFFSQFRTGQKAIYAICHSQPNITGGNNRTFYVSLQLYMFFYPLVEFYWNFT